MGAGKAMRHAVAWLQIVIVVCLLGYSIQCLFKGDFEQACLPYPVLIIYYLVFARSKAGCTSGAESQDDKD
ncbi:MAG: hypothetical protein BA861_06700 [Desulfobacterales bacterium S3730MH5]|nr:MAG: hypothetical protein BA861_06700 [Desulfobacterales bacterium S3730MH5]